MSPRLSGQSFQPRVMQVRPSPHRGSIPVFRSQLTSLRSNSEINISVPTQLVISFETDSSIHENYCKSIYCSNSVCNADKYNALRDQRKKTLIVYILSILYYWADRLLCRELTNGKLIFKMFMMPD